MRHIGVSAYGIRTPLITRGDDLPVIVAESLLKALESEGLTLRPSDIIGVTEAVVAKSQCNFAHINDIAADIRAKFGDNTVGVVFPIFSRNRFLNILKGISLGAKQVKVLLQLPYDEFGNPIMDIDITDDIEDELVGLLPSSEFKRITGEYKHPFTGVDYIELYEQLSDNIEVYLSTDPRDILKLTEHILVCDVHTRSRTKSRLLKAGAKTVYTLVDILQKPINGSGYNPDYGLLGSNLSSGEELKLFPRDCDKFVKALQDEIESRTSVRPEVLVYGDGAFKDPRAGIWELADPVVSPGHTERLGGQPDEIKLKLAAGLFDNIEPKAIPEIETDRTSSAMKTENQIQRKISELPANASEQEKQEAIKELIRQKSTFAVGREGTTPRIFADLVGSLCDLMSGSGDKGTPVVLIKGYFDDYASE